MSDFDYVDYLNLQASLREAMEERIRHLEMPRWWQWFNRTWVAKVSRMNTKGLQNMFDAFDKRR